MGRPWAEATILGLAAAVEVLSFSTHPRTLYWPHGNDTFLKDQVEGSAVSPDLEFILVFQELAPVTKKPAVFYDLLNTNSNHTDVPENWKRNDFIWAGEYYYLCLHYTSYMFIDCVWYVFFWLNLTFIRLEAT